VKSPRDPFASASASAGERGICRKLFLLRHCFDSCFLDRPRHLPQRFDLGALLASARRRQQAA
jgi:hypothetical protein